MEFNGWNSFEDFARACGYTNCNNGSDNASKTGNDNATNNFCNDGCRDIPNGFQSLNPQLFVVIGEILGDMLSECIPFNVQVALGNWLVLVGQVLLTYNSQQLYFQQGPGRFFNPNNYNVDNQFCNTTPTNTPQNNNSSSNNNNNNNNKDKNSSSNSTAKSAKNNADKMDALELRINELTTEIEKMKNIIEK
ncbi:hypothetical protein [Clostridium sp.]|uniref:hypothetical protein n=1 Tax=Clostridium sp. TaxID=1506 RepID=UPI002846DB3E|nr:hypothetical protein [Clostridium sp.]MDR3594512.1 hypothetical protein [Clostridium sp.]